MEMIEIRGLEVEARHGVGAQERAVGNLFRVDVTLTLDLSRAMESDCVDDTVNYADVVALVRDEMAVPSNLLENVAWRIRRAVCRRYPAVAAGSVRVEKVHPPIPAFTGSVAVTTAW